MDTPNDLEALLIQFGLTGVAHTLAELISQNDRSQALNELTIRLAMAYGARAAIQAQGMAFVSPPLKTVWR